MFSLHATPFSYQEYNTGAGLVTPSTVHVSNTNSAHFFKRQLFQRVLSVFEWEIPQHWARNYFEAVLYYWGYIAVIRTDRLGVIPQAAGLRGYDVFYQPTNAIITNPLLHGIMEPRIGAQCEIIKIAPDYLGVADIGSYYGDLLALTAEALGMNLANSKLAYVFFSQNKAAAESFKKLFDQISQGNPAAVVDTKLRGDDGSQAWEFFAQNLAQNHISPDLLNELAVIRNHFDTEIGIPNANTTKRERLITSEVESNNVDTYSKAAVWLQNMRDGAKKVNRMFGTNLKVDFRFSGAKEVLAGNEQQLDVPNGTDVDLR